MICSTFAKFPFDFHTVICFHDTIEINEGIEQMLQGPLTLDRVESSRHKPKGGNKVSHDVPVEDNQGNPVDWNEVIASDEWVGSIEAASIAGMTKAGVDLAAKENRLRAIKLTVGSKSTWFFHRQSVEEYQRGQHGQGLKD